MIRAVLFDYGGVLSKGGRPGEVTQKIAHNLNRDIEAVGKAVKPVLMDFAKGKCSVDRFWKRIEVSLEIDIAKEKRDVWLPWSDFVPNPSLLKYIQTLKSEGYHVGMISNVFPNTARMIRDNGGYDEFETLILSCDVGYSKPDIEMFDLALRDLDVKPQESIFIDDQEKCLEPAKKLGMYTILAQNPTQVITDLKELLSKQSTPTQ